MSDNNIRNGGSVNAAPPDFDAEAFKKRFNEIAAGNGDKTAQPQRGAAAPVKKKKHTVRKIICILLAAVLLLAGSTAGAVVYVTKDYKATELQPNAYADENSMMQAPGVTNILLMGVDTKNMQDNSRSDSMILLTVDTVHGKLKLTSFMRDMYVAVPGHGNTKLTHACAYAGPQLTLDTIELNFNVKIDGYIKISYALFEELVDGIGGITVPEIDAVEAKAIINEGVGVKTGTNIHLNGIQALTYCRIRKGQSDFQRTERQREVLSIIVKKMLRTSPFKLLKVARALAAKAECSMEKNELISLALKALPCLAGEVVQQRVPLDGTWSSGTRDGLSVLLVDFEKNRAFLKETLY